MSRLKNFLRGQAIKVLEDYEKEITSNANSLPIDRFLKKHFLSHKNMGSTERSNIIETVNIALKQKVYLDAISPKPVTWESRLETLKSKKFYDQYKNPSLLPQVRCSCPRELWNLIVEEYGEDEAFEYMSVMNEKAPITIRSNPNKITRNKLYELLTRKYGFDVKLCEHSPLGITFKENKNQNFFDIPEFAQGFFEVQDEGSQLVALRVKCKPNQLVLDFCAGAGGKSLAFGPQMKGTGQLFLHEPRYARDKILSEARKRFSRAGINNIQFHEDETNLKKFTGKFDWVVIDVPCTGTGTLRRNADLKIKFNLERLKYYTELQESIAAESIKYLRPNGRLVYMTCSLLPQENLQQIKKICNKHNMELEDDEVFQILPKSGEMDCFFSATLKFKD